MTYSAKKAKKGIAKHMRQCLSLLLYGIIAKFPYGKLRINSIFICTFAVVMHRRLMAEVLNGKINGMSCSKLLPRTGNGKQWLPAPCLKMGLKKSLFSVVKQPPNCFKVRGQVTISLHS